MQAMIRFKDGTILNAEQNGNCFITNRKPDFPADLSVVEIGGNEPQTLHNAQLVECASIDGRYWFTFIEISDAEQWKKDIENAVIELAGIIAEG